MAIKHIKILLADDHEILREGLTSLLEDQDDFSVVGHASNGREAVNMVNRINPDIIVMDVNMPQMNGIEATREIVAQHPQARVIGLSVNDDGLTRRSMLDAGACAYVMKDDPSELLYEAIRGAVANPSS